MKCEWCMGDVAPGTRHEPTSPCEPCVVIQEIPAAVLELAQPEPAAIREPAAAVPCPICGAHAYNLTEPTPDDGESVFLKNVCRVLRAGGPLAQAIRGAFWEDFEERRRSYFPKG